MAKGDNLGDLLKSIADAIRTKKGTAVDINPQNFDLEIMNISSPAKYVSGSWNKDKTAHDGTVLDSENSSSDVFVQIYILANGENATMSGTIQGCDDVSFSSPVDLQTFTYTSATFGNTGTTYTYTASGYRYYRVNKGPCSATGNTHFNYFMVVK